MTGETGREHVERLLTKANALRARGDNLKAESTCREALALAPEDPGVLELLGDLLLAAGKPTEAQELFRKAFARRPERGVLEEKIALAALKSDASLRAAQKRLQQGENPQLDDRKPRNPVLAFFLSSLLPGMGQMYNGDYWKGGVLFLAALFTFGVLFYSVTGLLAAAAHVRHESTLTALSDAMQNWSTVHLLWVLVNCLAFMGVWGYSLIEAPVHASRYNTQREQELGIL